MSDPFSAIRADIGETRRSDWLLVDQVMIDRFADATLDHQFIHVDPVRAVQTPFGGTIAHGFLTLSLLSFLQESIAGAQLGQIRMSVNYGFDRVRFISPVRSGRHVRAVSTLVQLEEKGPLTVQLTHDVTVEIQGEDKPAMSAAWLTRLMF